MTVVSSSRLLLVVSVFGWGLASLPAEEVVTPRRNARGETEVRLICGDLATDARLAAMKEIADLRAVQLFGNREFTDAGLEHLSVHRRLLEVGLGGKQLTGDCLKPLRGHPELQHVSLTNVPMTRATAETLNSLPRLASLTLRDTNIEPSAWELLATSPTLRRLSLTSTSLSDQELSRLSQFRSLRQLSLRSRDARLTEAALTALANSSLETLGLDGITLTPQGVRVLESMPALRELTLRNSAPTAETFASIAGLRLRELTIAGPVSDAELTPLYQAKQLHLLDLYGTNVSRDVTSFLRANLVNAVVNPWRWPYSATELKGISHSISKDDAGQVTRIDLSGLKYATDAKVRVIRRFPHVTQLRLMGGDGFTDESLRLLQSLPELADLEIEGSQLTLSGLKELSQTKSLRRLAVGSISESERNELRAALANVEVVPFGSPQK